MWVDTEEVFLVGVGCKRDCLVADVFTDSPSEEHGDIGGILHMGVGDVNLAMVVVDNALYAGPVYSYYVFVTAGTERITDEASTIRLLTLKAPQWAADSFLTDDPEHTVSVAKRTVDLETEISA